MHPDFPVPDKKVFLKGPEKQSQHSLRVFSQVKSLGIKSRTAVLDILYFTYFLVWFLLRLQVQGLGHNKCYILMSCLNTIESAQAVHLHHMATGLVIFIFSPGVQLILINSTLCLLQSQVITCPVSCGRPNQFPVQSGKFICYFNIQRSDRPTVL